MNPLIQLKKTPPLLVILTLLCFPLLPRTQAVVPAPDGGYPNFTTAEGTKALQSLTTGSANTGVGWYSLFSATTGSFNTGVGAGTLVLNSGDENTATGVAALLLNTAGFANTANGALALLNNTTGSVNTANGAGALGNNTTGEKNTANGYGALFSNIDGESNNAIGYQALFSHQTGSFNNALGFNALINDTGGVGNTAVGDSALQSSTGNNNTAIGESAGANATTGDGNVYVGAGTLGVAGEAAHTYIRNINTTSVSGGNADSVTVDLTTGLLGHLSSSRRYKENIKSMDNNSEALYLLKPVTYRYKKEIDATQSSAFGLIAEEVAEANPDLVARNAKGQPESVHYDMVNAMLLNEFLKEHRKVEQMQKQIEALSAGLEKVSAQLELNKAAPQVVKNP